MNRIRLSLCLAVCVLPTFGLTGCGGGNTSDDPSSNGAVANGTTASNSNGSPNTGGSNTEGQTSAGSSTSGSSATDKPRRQNERWTDANGVEYLGNVPLDVFFDQPHTVASDQTVLGGSAVAATTAPANAMSGMTGSPMGMPSMQPSTDAAAEPAPPETASGNSWPDLISAEEIKTEITDSRNFLNKSLQRYGDYKKAMLMIPGKAASIAVLSHIAMQHPEEVSWKADAIYIRDLAKKMNEETLKPDKKSHERVLTLFENIASTLDRSRPADLEEPSTEDSYVDVAGMDMLMVRLDEAEKRLKTEAGSQSAFETKKEMIKHEAALLGTLSHVITLEGYGYADDDEFKGYANSIVKAARTIRDSVDTNDFDSYELALSKVSTSCSDCHSAYRNN